jgi:hypothetical protein
MKAMTPIVEAMTPAERDGVAALFAVVSGMAVGILIIIGVGYRHDQRPTLVVAGFVGLVVSIVSWVVLRRYI